jgi:hypothetical protein
MHFGRPSIVQLQLMLQTDGWLLDLVHGSLLGVSLLVLLVVQSRRPPFPRPCRRDPLKLRGAVILREDGCGADLGSGFVCFHTFVLFCFPDYHRLVELGNHFEPSACLKSLCCFPPGPAKEMLVREGH